MNNWTIDGIIIDTDRDALDIDNSQNVTVRNSVFNSIQDDALVLKASFALGTFTPTRNVLLENDIVSGYEAGSVLSGAYAQGQLTPMTGRVKLGTEATGGFDTITIRNIIFHRCAGFAIESVDGAVLTEHRIYRFHDERCLYADIHSARRSGPHAGHRYRHQPDREPR